MSNKGLVGLALAAVVLGGAAYFLNNGSRASAPRLNGRLLFPGLDLSAVARVEIGDRLTLAAGEGGWTVESLHGYPADRAKIVQNLLKLGELKVGQVVRGKKIGSPLQVALKDASGRALATLPLGERHAKWGHGRYASFAGETVLVADALDAFDGEIGSWCDTSVGGQPTGVLSRVSIAWNGETTEFERGTNRVWSLKGLAEGEELDDSRTQALDSALSYLSFKTIADPALTEAQLGFATGCVYSATYAQGSNSVTRVARVGNATADGSGRYLRFDGGEWTFVVPSYSAQGLMKRRADFLREAAKPGEAGK